MINKKIEQKGLEYCYDNNELYCIIVRSNFDSNTITFFTPNDFSQQFGCLTHKKGAIVKPHLHLYKKREVFYTLEVLLIRKGKVKINFYDLQKKYLFSEILSQDDSILLCRGGHGLEIIEDACMIKVKQGPFLGEDDKCRFKGIERIGQHLSANL
jgi:hypothetical protein